MTSFEPPSGTVLRDPDSTIGRRTMRVLVMLPLGALFLAIFIGFGPALVIGLLALAVLGLLSKDALQAALRWHPPQIEVASTAYPLGAAPTIIYRRKPKRPTDVSDCAVVCRLYCQERVVYTRGTDTTTETNDVFEAVTHGTGEGTADGLVAPIDIQISAHAGGPSLELSHNQVRWFVEIRVRGARLPKDSHTFALQVAPQLDANHRVGVQDS